MSISPSRAWFGGDLASIVGKCECTEGNEITRRFDTKLTYILR